MQFLWLSYKNKLSAETPLPQVSLRDSNAARGETVEGCNADLEFCDLRGEVTGRQTLAAPLDAMHLGRDAASALMAAP